MNQRGIIPNSAQEALLELRKALSSSLHTLPKTDFLRAWSALAYAFPGLHPDDWNEEDSGWPQSLKSFAEEAWRRTEVGELSEDELYPCDAQWAGLYDRMHEHEQDETDRRFLLASDG